MLKHQQCSSIKDLFNLERSHLAQLQNDKYGSRLHIWSWKTQEHKQARLLPGMRTSVSNGRNAEPKWTLEAEEWCS